MTDITIHMRKNDGLENLKKKKKIFFFFFFFVFSHPGGSNLLTGVRESGSISGRLPDDPGGFTCMSRAANSVVGGLIWPKFELIHNIMHVLVTSKFEKDRININRDYVMTSIF